MAGGDKIKGLTVKIGADTSDFIKELKKVDKEINSTQKSATALQKGLELEFDDKRFVQAQKKAQQALTETEQKAEAIRKQLKYLEDTGGVDTEGYEKLQTELASTETKALQLKQQLDKIDELKFKNAVQGIETLGKKIDTLATKTRGLSLASAGALAGATALAKGSIETGDAIQTTADQYNLSAEAIQRWNYIALQSDVSAEQIYKSMAKVKLGIGTALAGGTSTISQALEALVGDLSQLPKETDQAFFEIVSAFAKVEDSALQAYYSNAVFGDDLSAQLLPLFKKGAQGIANYAEEFEALGYLTDTQVSELATLDGEFDKINAQLDISKTKLGITMIPLLDTVNDILVNFLIPAMKNLADWFDSLGDGGQKFVIVLLGLLAVLSPTLQLIGTLITDLPKLIKWVKDLNKQTLATTAGITALAGALMLGINLIADWKNMSTVEKILKSLALAALVAAGAITVFHASWSLGLAVGGIVAGVVAGISAIKSATEELGVEDDGQIDSLSSSVSGTGYGYTPTTTPSGGNTYNEDNSQYSIEVNLNATGELEYDARSLADEVIKQIQIKKQAGG